MVDYKWDAERFLSNEEMNEDEKLFVALPNGSSAEIEQLLGDVSKKDSWYLDQSCKRM